MGHNRGKGVLSFLILSLIWRLLVRTNIHTERMGEPGGVEQRRTDAIKKKKRKKRKSETRAAAELFVFAPFYR